MSSSKQEAKVVYISPQIAERMLKQDAEIRQISGQKNRKVHKNTIDKLSKDMENDRWILTGSAIQFDVDGHLIDGQHRLMAVIKTGKTCPFFVVTGLEVSAFSVLDQAKRRSIQDMLYIEGVQYYSYIGTVANRILNWKQIGQTEHNNAKISVREALQFCEKNKKALHESAYLILGSKRPMKGLRLGNIIACHYLFSEKNKLEADHFMQKLMSGEDCVSALEKMIFKLRELLIRDGRSKKRLDSEDYTRIIIRVWNAYRQGRVLKMLSGDFEIREII